MPEKLFRCTICHFTTHDESIASACEGQGTPNFAFEIGEQFKDSIGSLYIINRYIAPATAKGGRPYPQHLPRYSMSRSPQGGRLKQYSEEHLVALRKKEQG